MKKIFILFVVIACLLGIAYLFCNRKKDIVNDNISTSRPNTIDYEKDLSVNYDEFNDFPSNYVKATIDNFLIKSVNEINKNGLYEYHLEIETKLKINFTIYYCCNDKKQINNLINVNFFKIETIRNYSDFDYIVVRSAFGKKLYLMDGKTTMNFQDLWINYKLEECAILYKISKVENELIKEGNIEEQKNNGLLVYSSLLYIDHYIFLYKLNGEYYYEATLLDAFLNIKETQIILIGEKFEKTSRINEYQIYLLTILLNNKPFKKMFFYSFGNCFEIDIRTETKLLYFSQIRLDLSQEKIYFIL